MNRHQRRRFDAEVHGKGTLSPELIDYYRIKIDYILSEINKRMNPPKVQPQNNNVQVMTTPPPPKKNESCDYCGQKDCKGHPVE
jgi:hypothetical protein